MCYNNCGAVIVAHFRDGKQYSSLLLDFATVYAFSVCCGTFVVLTHMWQQWAIVYARYRGVRRLSMPVGYAVLISVKIGWFSLNVFNFVVLKG